MFTGSGIKPDSRARLGIRLGLVLGLGDVMRFPIYTTMAKSFSRQTKMGFSLISPISTRESRGIDAWEIVMGKSKPLSVECACLSLGRAHVSAPHAHAHAYKYEYDFFFSFRLCWNMEELGMSRERESEYGGGWVRLRGLNCDFWDGCGWFHVVMMVVVAVVVVVGL